MTHIWKLLKQYIVGAHTFAITKIEVLSALKEALLLPEIRNAKIKVIKILH